MQTDIFIKERILVFDKAYKVFCYMLLERMQKGLATDKLDPPDNESLKYEFALFFPVWRMAEEFAKDAEKRADIPPYGC